MITKKVSWETFKSFVSSRSALVNFFEDDLNYEIYAIDTFLGVQCNLIKDSSDAIDFENNYKNLSNKRLDIPKDSDGSPLQRSKVTTTGWHYQLHGVEFQTSQLDSIYSKKSDGNDFGFVIIKCYDEDGNILSTQEECDSFSVKTVIDWEPTHDYEIIGGIFKQSNLPSEDVRMWVVGVPDVPAAYGGSKEFASNINLKFLGLEEGIRVDGRAPKYMAYSAIYHSNKIRLILTHPAAFKHKVHLTLEIFEA